jgi:hypothetical protein
MSRQIAETIVQQIMTLTPVPVRWSWGARNWQCVDAGQIEGIGEDYLGALKFNVSGHHHKGHVIVSLAGNDTYTVTIGHVRKGKIKPKKQVKDVYFDMLGDIIDDLVERIEAYA